MSLLFLLMSGCYKSDMVEDVDISTIEVDTLHFSPIRLSQPVFRPRQVLLQRESGIITYFDDVEHGVFKIFSYPGNEFLFRYPEVGNERDASSFIDESAMESFPDRIRYLDYPYLREVFVDTAKKTFIHQSYVDLTEISQDIQSALQLNDTLFFARNIFSGKEDLAHFTFVKGDNKKNNFFGKYPKVGINFKDYESKYSFFRYRPVVNRELKKIMIFYVKLNKIRLYDFSGNQLKEINVNSFLLPLKQEEEQIYFESPFAVGDKVYVLYLNENHNSVNANVEDLRPELQVYSWGGELLERYKMDASVYKYAIDPINGKVVGVTFSDDEPIVEALLSPPYK